MSTPTLVSTLQNLAQENPSSRVYTWLVDGEREGASLSYGELDRKARSLAWKLNSLQLKQNRALLLYGPGLEFIEALFGCLYAGIIAVPAYIPGSSRDHPRIESILRDADCGIALTSQGSLEVVSQFLAGVGQQTLCLATDVVENIAASEWSAPPPRADQIAYLQYTSGSTAAPKGVVITHANVIENLKYIAAQGGFGESTVSVSWLPHFHDMGLIYGILQPLFTRFPAILFSPAAFLYRPVRWLSAISRYRGTHCGGPNFAYDLCVDRITAEDCSQLDLSSWRVAFNGSEPVRTGTLDRFAGYFSGCGFDRKSFYPVYGLAEASLKVASGEPGVGPTLCGVDAEQLQKHKVCLETPESGLVQTFVGCGRAGQSHEIVLVDSETLEPCADDHVGEIWVSGPSVACGYWNNPAATETTFQAFTKDGKGPYLRTGDLGFFYEDDLYVTGRLKDCIIVRGRNHYPNDIEKTIEECHPALRRNGGAAFSIEHSGQEVLVILSEINRKYRGDLKSVVEAVRKAISEIHELQAFAVVLVKAGSLSKTSSGKIQRQACKTKFLEDALAVLEKSVLAPWYLDESPVRFRREDVLGETAGSRIERIADYLKHVAARTLHHSADEIALTQSLVSLGMDSLALFDLKQRIEDDLHVAVPFTELLNGTLHQFAAKIEEHIELSAPQSANQLQCKAAALDVAPLSFAQEQVWLMQQLFPESCAYNELLVVRLTGSLDLRAIHRAIHGLVRRHEILRTHFGIMDGDLRQKVQPPSTLDLSVTELGSRPAIELELQSIVVQEVKRPFQLDQGLPVRFRLARAGEQEHFLILVAHHIVCDGTSLGVVVRELGALYQAFGEGKELPLLELRFQYADFATWQRQWMQSEALDKQLAYWREQLAGVPVLELRAGDPRPAAMGHEGGSVELQIAAELTGKVKELSRRENSTLFMSVMAVFQVLLSKYSGQHDFAVGMPVANRRREGTQDLIGFFVNTIALRARLNGQMNFLQSLNRVRQATIEGYEHQDVPFAKLVEELQPERDLSRTPLFQAMLVFQPAFSRELTFGNLKFSLLEVETGIAKFDLTLRVIESASGLQAFLEYNRDIFEAESIQRMAGHLSLLLEKMVFEPEQSIAEISMLTEVEERQLLIEWNRTHAPYSDACVHELFEDQVARTPNAIAVECEGRQLTYGQLDRRANQLGHLLKKLGVGPEVRVAICVERSPEMVVGLLGILKAGGAYVPLDSRYPAERLAYILEDADAAILLAQAQFAGEMGSYGPTLVQIDDWQQFSQESEEKPANIVRDSNLAYVIYTSGSTGKPKGVMVSHGAFANHLHWRQRAYPLLAEDRFLHKASLSFDIAGWEIFAPLLAGAQLIMAGPQGQQDSAYLVRLIAEKGVTVAHFNPAMLQAVLEEPGIQACRRLKHVFCGGEIMSTGLEKLFFSTLPANLHNQYGPTETTVDVLCWDCDREQPSRRSVPIGRPVDNTSAYILDSGLQPVAMGVAGELYIGGLAVARGYLNLAAMTSERFIPDPFGTSSARLFKTGDLARYRADGSIEFLGRQDRQVKVRGFRIELEEIEHVLLGHPAVKEVSLVVHQAGDGNQGLIAYLASRAPGSELRNYLKSKVPEYMVPAVFVILEELPRLPSGKVDIQALSRSALAETPASEERKLTAPEELLTTIWEQLLGVNQVGPEENFFDLGGHSVLATRLISRVREVFAIELPLRAVFEAPTVAELSSRVEAARASRNKIALPAIAAVGREQDLPLSFAQQQMWLLHQLHPRSPAYNMAVALWLQGSLDVEALEHSFSEIIRRHEVLRTCFPERNGTVVQEILPPAPLAVPILDLRESFHGLKEEEWLEEIRRLVREEGLLPFDLACGPLLRVKLLRVSNEKHLLLVTMHHVVGDGWSTGILVRELTHLYRAYAKGEQSQLAELTLQYADFAVWQRNWLQGDVLESHLSYWREQLSGLEALDLPTDHPRPAIMSQEGSSVCFQLPLELATNLKALGRRESVTHFMSVMAAFQVMLSRYAGRDNVAVGTAIANRNRAEIEGLIGFFANTLVLRTDLAGNPSFLQVLKRMRQVTLNAYQHQNLPFEKLVEELSPQRDPSRSPLFQVMLVMQNDGQPELQLPGLQVTEFETGSEGAKLDLSLSLRERAGGMEGKLVYARDLYDESTMLRMVGHLQRIMQDMVAGPEKRLSEVSLLSDEERGQVVEEWNQTKVEYSHACVQELFEEQVRKNGSMAAVEYEGQELTYAELNRRANRLAHYLRKIGVGPDVRVGICMERSLELVVGLLGILKAGGAYVPIDPQYPMERCRYMLEDTQAHVVLAGPGIEESHLGAGFQVICMEEETEQIAEESADNLLINTAPENLAYVIYTSGSTGKPKGVAVTHGNLSNHMRWMLERYPWRAGDAVLQKTSIGFDAAVWEFYAPLLSGGLLALPVAGGHHNLGYMVRQIQEKKITILQLVPSVLRLLLQEPDFRECKSLRYVFCGGEALTADLVNQLWSQLQIEVVNLYGPTEATIDAAYWSNCPAGIESVPIGRPIANTQAYVLDEFLNLVPPGVVGELFLAGKGLARGYWGQPALTAERFLPDPFSKKPGGRMYCTGDQVKWRNNGELEYLGRADQQVKIRGFRIELGEIEAVLGRQAGVRECAVVAHEEREGEKRLVAYVVSRNKDSEQEPELNGTILRQSLKGKLPEYMVPSDFVMLEALPLTSSGKLDRKALPMPEFIGRDGLRYVAPRNKDEEVLCGIFAEVLTLDSVGIEDNFFELGGHSLLATQVISRVRNVFQVELSLQTMLEMPTVAELSGRIEEYRCAMNV